MDYRGCGSAVWASINVDALCNSFEIIFSSFKPPLLIKIKGKFASVYLIGIELFPKSGIIGVFNVNYEL